MKMRVFAALAAVALFALAPSFAQADSGLSAGGAMVFEGHLAKAFTDNNADELASLLASDWIVVSAFGQTAGRDGVIDAVRQKQWIHAAMDISQPRVRVYGNTAVVTYRLRTAGVFGGKKFDVLERETDVLVWQANAWKAVLTHETFLKT